MKGFRLFFQPLHINLILSIKKNHLVVSHNYTHFYGWNVWGKNIFECIFLLIKCVKHLLFFCLKGLRCFLCNMVDLI